MARPLDPILGPDGKRLWVSAGDTIGAEEVNAACEWTRRVMKALKFEHSESGHHGRAFQPIGAVRFVMPHWRQGRIDEGHVYGESFLLGRTEEEYPGTFKIVAGDPSQPGWFTIEMDPNLPVDNYFVLVHGQPQPTPDGYRRFRFWRGSSTAASFQLQAHGNPISWASRGDGRLPVVAAIYAERRF